MTMIAFITISSLVPLIEGPCSSDWISIRVLGFTFTSFAMLFWKEKFFKEKKQLVHISSCLTANIYTCVLCTHIRIHICRDLVHLNFSGPSKSLVPTPGLTSNTLCAVCVCVCVYTHTHPRTLPSASKIEKTQDNTSVFPFVKNNFPRQATSALFRLVESPHPPSRPPTRMKKLRIHEHMCTPFSDCVADMYYGGDVKNTCWCTHLHALVPRTRSPQKRTYTRANTPDGAATCKPCKPSRPILQLELSSRNRQNPRLSMTQPLQLRYQSVIIWSSVLVRARSSLSMIRTWSLATVPIHQKNRFLPLFSRVFDLLECTSMIW